MTRIWKYFLQKEMKIKLMVLQLNAATKLWNMSLAGIYLRYMIDVIFNENDKNAEWIF